MSDFTQGVCDDGTAILKDGQPLTPEQIINALNRAEEIAVDGFKKENAFIEINALCWKAIGSGKREMLITDVLDIVEKYCE